MPRLPVPRLPHARPGAHPPAPAFPSANADVLAFAAGNARRWGRAGRVATVATVMAVMAAGLAACTGGGSETTSGTQRFISGDGVVHYVPAARREPGPEVAGETLDGERLDLGSLRAGGVAVVNIWGSWCAPCKKEQGALERVARATRSRGVRFVGINIRDASKTAARLHVTKYDVTYPSIYDPSARLLPRFKIAPKTIPSTYVIDPAGRIAAYVYGAIEERPLADLVDRVLAESGPA